MVAPKGPGPLGGGALPYNSIVKCGSTLWWGLRVLGHLVVEPFPYISIVKAPLCGGT